MANITAYGKEINTDTTEGLNSAYSAVAKRANELATTPPTTPEKKERYSRYNTGASSHDLGYTTADGGYSLPNAGPQTPEQIQASMVQSAQGEINSLRDYERTLLDEQAVINAKNDRSTSAISTLTGLSGSTEADTAQQRTTAAGQKANQAIRAETELKVQSLLGNIRASAVTEARAQREEARMDETARLESRKARQEEALSNLTNLTASGVTYDGFKKTDPEGFRYLAQQFGGEQALRGAFLLNTPQDQILDKKQVGSTYIISRQNPITGKVSVETLDIPGLPPDYSASVDLGDRIMFYDPSDPQGKQFFMGKGMTPSQAANAGGGDNSGTYENDLDAIIGATLSTIPSKFGQATFQSQMNKARNDSDKINLVAAQVLKGQPSEVRTDFANQAVGISEIDKAIKLIDSGVKSGFINDKKQYTFNLFGKDYDPALAQLSAHITGAIQPYRNSVTGAAWGNQEDIEYQQLFGSTKYEPAALRQRLVTLKDILKNKSATGLNTFVNPMGFYDNAFDTGNYAPSGDLRSRVDAAGFDYDAMKADGLSDEEIQSSL